MTAPAEIGGFELRELLGRGGMAEVWRAEHPTGLVVAIKRVSAARARERVVRDALMREARAVARLRHRHVVTLFDAGVAQGAPYLVMELAAGTLADHPVSWDILRTHLRSLLDALAYAHARDVVHRDVKPSNVLVTHDGDVRLADFGLASAVSRLPVGGTPGYMAPEQLDGGPVGPRADLYALGCLAWALVSRRRPWEVRGPGEPLPTLPPGAPEGLDDWIARATAQRAADRFPTAADARDALSELGDDSAPGVAATPIPSAAAAATVAVPAMSLPATVSRYLGTEPATLWADPMGVDEPLGLPTPDSRAPVPPARWREHPPLTEPPRGLGTSLLALREPPVIGRPDEQRHLWQHAVALRDGVGAIVVVRGEPGSGRTHLARWALRIADEHGLAARIEGPDVAPTELTALAGARAVAWLVDDADADTVSRCTAALAHPFAPTTLLISTGPPELAVPEGAHALDLGPLARHDALQLIEGVLGLKGSAADGVIERAQGNPGLAVALVRDWGERGLLQPGPTGIETVEGQALPLPESLASVEARCLAAVSEPARQALELAVALDEPVEPEARDELESTGLVDASGHPARPALAETVRSAAEEAGRWPDVCEQVVARRADAEEDDPVVARALVGCGRLDEAATRLGLVGQTLRKRGASAASTAALLEQRAVLGRLGVAQSDDRWLDSAFQLGLNAIYRHRFDEAERWIGVMEDTVRSRPDGSGAARTEDARGQLAHVRMDLDAAQHHFEATVRAGQTEGLPFVEAYATQRLGSIARQRGRMFEALALLGRAEEMWRQLGADDGVLGVLIVRAYVLDGQRDPTAGPLLDQVILAAPGTNLGITAHLMRGHIRRRARDVEGAQSDYTTALEGVVALGSGRLPMPLIALASLDVDRGDPVRARATFTAIEPQCVGQYRLFWCGASLPAFVTEADFESRLDRFIALVEQTGSVDPEHAEGLQQCASLAEDAGRTDVAARCRHEATRLAAQLEGTGKDAVASDR